MLYKLLHTYMDYSTHQGNSPHVHGQEVLNPLAAQRYFGLGPAVRRQGLSNASQHFKAFGMLEI